MNPQDPLAGLRPLREPSVIDWWPLAPGWWLLAIAAVLILGFAAFTARRYWLRNAYRRQALKQLAALQQPPTLETDASYATKLNALLKSTALAAYPAKEVAAKHGEEWRAFLNQSLSGAEQFQAAFFDAAYVTETGSQDRGQLDRVQLHRCAQCWIKTHRVAQ